MPRISARQKALEFVQGCDEQITFQFYDLEKIIERLNLPNVALAYCFQQIETGQRRTLYAGIVRKYRTNPRLTSQFVDKHTLYQDDFRKLFGEIFGRQPNQSVEKILERARAMRNKITHGQKYSLIEAWNAVIDCLEYCQKFNDKFFEKEGFSAFGRHQGITKSKSRGILNRETSRLVLNGLGFKVSREAVFNP